MWIPQGSRSGLEEKVFLPSLVIGGKPLTASLIQATIEIILTVDTVVLVKLNTVSSVRRISFGFCSPGAMMG